MSLSFENPASSQVQAEFQKLTQIISTNIQKITTNVTQMQNLQGQIAAKQHDLDLQDKFHSIQHHTNTLAKETGKKIKEFSDCTPANPADHKLHKIRKERFVNDFTKVLNSFQVLQRQEKSFERTEQDKRTSSLFSHEQGATTETQDNIGARDQQQQQQQQQQVTLQVESTEADLELLEQREEAVRQLESDITDVNNIFKDLAILVHDQGETIDTIEANTESAVVDVERGTEELRIAQNYSTKARKKKFCLIGTLLIIIIIIVIVLAVVYT